VNTLLPRNGQSAPTKEKTNQKCEKSFGPKGRSVTEGPKRIIDRKAAEREKTLLSTG